MVLPIQILDLAVMVLILLSESANDLALSLYLSLQILVRLLHQKYFFLLLLLLFE